MSFSCKVRQESDSLDFATWLKFANGRCRAKRVEAGVLPRDLSSRWSWRSRARANSSQEPKLPLQNRTESRLSNWDGGAAQVLRAMYEPRLLLWIFQQLLSIMQTCALGLDQEPLSPFQAECPQASRALGPSAAPPPRAWPWPRRRPPGRCVPLRFASILFFLFFFFFAPAHTGVGAILTLDLPGQMLIYSTCFGKWGCVSDIRQCRTWKTKLWILGPKNSCGIHDPRMHIAEQWGLRLFLPAALVEKRSSGFLDAGTWLRKNCLGLYPMAVETWRCTRQFVNGREGIVSPYEATARPPGWRLLRDNFFSFENVRRLHPAAPAASLTSSNPFPDLFAFPPTKHFTLMPDQAASATLSPQRPFRRTRARFAMELWLNILGSGAFGGLCHALKQPSRPCRLMSM